MRVFIDYRPALVRPTGVGRYLKYLVPELLQQDPELQLILFSSSFKDRFWSASCPDQKRCHIVDRRIPVRILNALWHRYHFPPAESLAPARFDLAHSPTPLYIPTRQAHRAITIHDLWFLNPNSGELDEMGRDYPRFLASSVNKSHVIFTVSRTVAQQLLDLFPQLKDRIVVTPHGTPPEFLKPPSPETVQATREQFRLPRDYALFVGSFVIRKNPLFLVETIAHLKQRGIDLPLVMVGDGPLKNAIIRRARERNVTVFVPGYIPRNRLPAVYAAARVFLLASHDEGFGLPILEAMALGIPVVALANGAVPEVAGEAGVLVHDPYPEAFADAIENLLGDSHRYRLLSNRGIEHARTFTWATSARATLEGYHRALQ